jgi:hypothetical protein
MDISGGFLDQSLNELLMSYTDYRANRQKLLDLATLITRAAREQVKVDTIADEALNLLEDLKPDFKFEIK